MTSGLAGEVVVNLGERSYPIAVMSGQLGRVGEFARARCRGACSLIVCDGNTERPLAQAVASSFEKSNFTTSLIALPPGEAAKSLESVNCVYAKLIECHADRQTIVVAVGGGVIGDLAGFAAATFARGVPLLQVPTSLLAQVDSSVGGKVGVNLHLTEGRIVKNMVGAFYQPVGVFIDTETLRSLPVEELRAGLAEVVKYGVILDPEFFAFLEANADAVLALDPPVIRHVIARCCRLKADIVEADERELSDRRAILNYGHTFAHAIEAVSRRFRHGEAVALGMVAASRLAESLGLVAHQVTKRQVQLLERFGLPTRTHGLNRAALIEAMQYDKKASGGQLRFVLPHNIGSVELVGAVKPSLVESVVRETLCDSG
jgi:3-dehydroquinate synthase